MPSVAAASDSRSSAHSPRVGTAVAPTGGTLGAFTVKSQVAVGGLAGRGPTWYSQVLGRAGSSTMRTLPPQLPRTVLPTGSGGETAQTCWGPGTGKSVQVMVNAPGGLLMVLMVAHWAWALPAARQALTDTERNRATRKMRRRSFMGARLGKKWTMPPPCPSATWRSLARYVLIRVDDDGSQGRLLRSAAFYETHGLCEAGCLRPARLPAFCKR